MAKHAGGRWLLRLDDLDAPRQVPGMADDIMRTLELFGLLWDGEVARQSLNLDAYQAAFGELQKGGMIYPCGCSRKEIARTSSAPHPDDDCIPYSGACHGGLKPGASVRSWRVKVPDVEICFNDLRKGRQCQVLPLVSGDFAVRRGDGEFAYQLAVVVDDSLAGVNQVVRGDDLLGSTSRQIYLQRLLGLPQPVYCHLPLVAGPDGAKLSKRDNLISHQLGTAAGREQKLLLAVLRFLGQSPPEDLVRSACSEILEWGAARFLPQAIPDQGGVLVI